MIEAIIFDVDGVLVQSGVFGERMQRELRVHPTEFEAFWRGPFARCSLGLADLKEEVAPWLEKWGYGGGVDECLQDWFEADSKLNTDLFAEVERLRRRGVPCHVATTQERYRAAYLEGVMGLSQRFDRLFFSCRLGVKKPDPQFYRTITSELGLAASALLLFDDQQANVDAARAAGWSAEVYALGDDFRPLLARYGMLGQE